ncbi:hypothetical protein C7J90_03820 [Staphylococcus felis]|nr:hypothetical protein C7J90_03820 [Staphylococcus felis]
MKKAIDSQKTPKSHMKQLFSFSNIDEEKLKLHIISDMLNVTLRKQSNQRNRHSNIDIDKYKKEYKAIETS